MLNTIAWLIAPPNCLNCGREGNVICTTCQATAVVKKVPTCFRCNKLSPGGRTCRSCRSSTKLSGVKVASHYDGLIKELIQILKYSRQREAAAILAQIMAVQIDPTDFDTVTAVPAATNRLRQRGFNQADLIARRLSGKLGLPYREVLGRNSNLQQVGKSRRQRMVQARELFRSKGDLNGQRILIVDDVVTTGATLSASAGVLKRAGAKSVWAVVAAKH